MQNDEVLILIVEDEPVWQSALASTLNSIGFGDTDTAASIEDAITLLNEKQYDFVLLDIDLNGRNTGIELGKMLNNVFKIPFIFITASQDKDVLLNAVTANPIAYITKPFNAATLFVTIQTAINKIQTNLTTNTVINSTTPSYFFVKVGGKYKKIEWKDVVHLSSEKKYTALFNAADSSSYFIRSSLQKTLQLLIPENMKEDFIQINRSEVINMAFVKEIKDNELFTQYGQFTISENYEPVLRRQLNILR